MGVRTSEALTVDGMSVGIYCAGQTTVGINIAGTWVGTVTFFGSTDGITFNKISMTPFPSGTVVSQVTANGNWFIPVQNYVVIKAQFARTSGTAQVIIVSAVDASWQNAFVALATLTNCSTANSGNNTLTQAAQANRSWNLGFLEVSFAGVSFPGGAASVSVYDGTIAGTLLFKEYILPPTVAGSVGWRQLVTLPPDGIVNTLGNAMTVVLAGVGSNSSIINTQFSAA